MWDSGVAEIHHLRSLTFDTRSVIEPGGHDRGQRLDVCASAPEADQGARSGGRRPLELRIVVADIRSVVRCPACGHKTAKVHHRPDVVVRDVDFGGRPTTLVWRASPLRVRELRRPPRGGPPRDRGQRHVRLARSLQRDARGMSIREVARRSRFSWHIMGLVRLAAEGPLVRCRRMRCRVLLVDETSLRRRHRYVPMVSDGESGALLGMVRGRDSLALQRLPYSFGPRLATAGGGGVSDGSKAYRTAIRATVPKAPHVADVDARVIP